MIYNIYKYVYVRAIIIYLAAKTGHRKHDSRYTAVCRVLTTVAKTKYLGFTKINAGLNIKNFPYINRRSCVCTKRYLWSCEFSGIVPSINYIRKKTYHIIRIIRKKKLKSFSSRETTISPDSIVFRLFLKNK